MASNVKVRKVTFTGSTEVGKKLTAQTAQTMKRVSMELGGNAPFVVFDDADLALTLNCAYGSKVRNAGQTCISTNRILVQEGIAQSFVTGLVERFKTLKVGDGFEDNVEVGPLINQSAVEHCEALLADAVSKGAKILLGGKRHALGGNFFEPTVLTGMTREMRIFHEEIFGPIAPIMTFASEAEAVELAVATFEALVVERGDSGKIWSSMLKEAMKRRKPDFNESHFGFRSFGNLLEEAQTRGLLEIGRDEKSGAFVSRSASPVPVVEVSSSVAEVSAVADVSVSGTTGESDEAGVATPPQQGERRSRNRNKRNSKEPRGISQEQSTVVVESVAADLPSVSSSTQSSTDSVEKPRPERQRKGQRPVRASDAISAPELSSIPSSANPTEPGGPTPDSETPPASGGSLTKPKKPRGRGTRKAKTGPSAEPTNASGSSQAG